jgi:hypothetical protein
MSSTRRSAVEGAFNQERYCSSPEYQNPLLANLVAKRCSLFADRKDAELIMWLQAQSLKRGGIPAMVERFIAFAYDRIGSPLMLEYGCKPHQKYSADQVRKLREELEPGAGDAFNYCGSFPLDGDLITGLKESSKHKSELLADSEDFETKRVKNGVKAFPAEHFKQWCLDGLKGRISTALVHYCLDPAADFPSWHYFFNLKEVLLEFKTSPAARDASGYVSTSVSEIIFRELKMAQSEDGFIFLEGLEEIGKRTAAVEWCELNSGLARYVKVPATSDDISFFREIATALGLSSALSLKGVQMRERIEYFLRTSKLMLVLDEAHALWPQHNRRQALPSRLNWIMNALVQSGVPVALIGSPQFSIDGRIVAQKTLWRSERLLRLLTHYRPLPDTLTEQDLTAITIAQLPMAGSVAVEAIVNYALSCHKHTSAITSIAKRAKAIAEENGRTIRPLDIRTAMEDVKASDKALARLMQPQGNRDAKRVQFRQQIARDSFLEADEHEPKGERRRQDFIPTENEAGSARPRQNEVEALGILDPAPSP